MAIQTSDPSIPAYDSAQLLDGEYFLLDLENITDGTGVDATPGSVTAAQFRKFVHSYLIAKTAHGFVSGDVGKPISSGAVLLDDTDETHYPIGIIKNRISADIIQAVSNGIVQFSESLMEAGYDIDDDGPYVYWDESAGKWVSSRPEDSNPSIREILFIQSIAGSVVTARVLDWGPPAGTSTVQPMQSGTATDGDTTPSVLGLSQLVLNNGSPTTITQLDDGEDGQRVALYCTGSDTTLTDGANIVCAGGSNVVLADGESAIFEKIGSIWLQTAAKVAH